MIEKSHTHFDLLYEEVFVFFFLWLIWFIGVFIEFRAILVIKHCFYMTRCWLLKFWVSNLIKYFKFQTFSCCQPLFRIKDQQLFDQIQYFWKRVFQLAVNIGFRYILLQILYVILRFYITDKVQIIFTLLTYDFKNCS